MMTDCPFWLRSFKSIWTTFEQLNNPFVLEKKKNEKNICFSQLWHNGIVKTAEELERENEFIVFYKNNKFKMKDEETTLNGIWKYNTKTRSLELNLIELGHKINFKIVKLNDNELSYIHEELDNNMIFNLKPNIKK